MPRRPFNQLRALIIKPHFLTHPEGSALIALGDTQVVCTASVEDRVPFWMMGKGQGWVTAEYDMLPRATSTRNPRDAHRAKIKARSQEISRLIGRSLRAMVDMRALGERTILVDCDVLQADGGTRTAAITGGYVALALAIQYLTEKGQITSPALKGNVAAISVGLLEGQPFLDLDASMDMRAQVDMNVVMGGPDRLIEIQGTGETATFSRDELTCLLDLAFESQAQLNAAQDRALATPYTAPMGARDA